MRAVHLAVLAALLLPTAVFTAGSENGVKRDPNSFEFIDRHRDP